MIGEEQTTQNYKFIFIRVKMRKEGFYILKSKNEETNSFIGQWKNERFLLIGTNTLFPEESFEVSEVEIFEALNALRSLNNNLVVQNSILELQQKHLENLIDQNKKMLEIQEKYSFRSVMEAVNEKMKPYTNKNL